LITENGVLVKNAPDGNTNAAAELAIGLMLAAARYIPAAHMTMSQGQWNKKQYKGIEISGKTIGVIGYGKIGCRVKDLLSGFNVTVLAYDPVPSNDCTDYVDVDTLLSKSDFVTLHTPKLDQPIIGERELSLMKNKAILVNASRGGNVDECALYNALEDRLIYGAAFDVYEHEGADGHKYREKLFKLPNFVGLPHIGASTEEAQIRTAEQMVDGIIGYLERGDLENAVNKI